MLSIEGLIGAGKSTLAAILRDAGVTGVVDEPIRDWKVGGIDILDAFYEDPQKYAYLFQSYVLRTRLKQVKDASIVERSLFSDSIFAEAQYRLGNMTELEYETYKVMYKDAVESIGSCAGRIHVVTSIDTCLQRIQDRNRNGEAGIRREYLELLHELHQTKIAKEKHVLVVDGETDFRDPAVREFLVLRIRSFLHALEKK